MTIKMSYMEIFYNFMCILITLILVCSLSRSMKFYIKLIFFYISIFTIAAVAIPFSARRPGDPGNLLYASWMVHHIFSPIFGLKWEVKNKELLNFKEPCVFVCNHQSALDTFGVMYILPLFHPCLPVLKRELLFSGPLGIFCWLAGCVFVDRNNSVKDRDMFNNKVEEMKKNNVKLWIFPEGTRNDKENLLPFKKGAFHIATKANIPIVPVVFSQYKGFYSTSKKLFEGGTITVTVLPSIKTDHLTPEDVPTLAEDVRSAMMTCLSESIGNDRSNCSSSTNE